MLLNVRKAEWCCKLPCIVSEPQLWYLTVGRVVWKIPSARHQDKCDVSCLGKKTKCTGIVWVVTVWAAELQRCSCITVTHRLKV